MIDIAPTKYLNSYNVHGGAFTTDKTAVSPNSNNIQFTSVGGSPAALEGNNVRMVVGGSDFKNNNNMLLKYMSGGGKTRKSGRRGRGRGRSKLHRKKRSMKMRRSHKYGTRSKHSKHSRSRSRRYSRRRGQSGGYHQYMGNTAFTLGQRIPGFPLPSNLSALANPAPFVPYQNCPGGR
jgi:hypothetical protein